MASSNRFEDVVEKLYQSMGQRIDRVAVNLRNEQPVGKTRKSRREQLTSYLQIRDDPQAWQGIIQKYGVKSAVKYRSQMEKQLQTTADKYMKEAEAANQIPGVNVFGENNGQAEME